MNRSVLTTAAALIGAVLVTNASAQAVEVPKAVKEAVPQINELLAPKGKLIPPMVMNNRGDAATAWVSPILRRQNNRNSGETYTINPKQFHMSFDFTVVNPDSQYAIEVSLSCFRRNGTQHPSYAVSLRAPRWGAATWEAGTVTPERSTDRSVDQDVVWCMLHSVRPFVAFGTRYEESDLGFDRYDVTLVPIAR